MYRNSDGVDSMKKNQINWTKNKNKNMEIAAGVLTKYWFVYIK